MKAFYYNSALYIKCTPAKSLFKSTMVHEVVNRGDVFALRVSDNVLTIIPGTAQVQLIEVAATIMTEATKVVRELDEPAPPRKLSNTKSPSKKTKFSWAEWIVTGPQENLFTLTPDEASWFKLLAKEFRG